MVIHPNFERIQILREVERIHSSEFSFFISQGRVNYGHEHVPYSTSPSAFFNLTQNVTSPISQYRNDIKQKMAFGGEI